MVPESADSRSPNRSQLVADQDRSRSPISFGNSSMKSSGLEYRCPQKELSPGILLDSHSTRISKIAKFGPAHIGRVLALGDHVVAVNGVPCNTDDLRRALFGNKNVIGSSAVLTIEREGEKLNAPVLLTPLQDIQAKDKLWRLLQELRKSITLFSERKAGIGLILAQDEFFNVIVEGVVEGSPAKICEQIEKNDVLYSIDGTLVGGRSGEDISELLAGRDGSPCHLVLLRGADKQVVEVTVRRAIANAAASLSVCLEIIEEINNLLEDIEQHRHADLASFLQHFQMWQKDVQKFMLMIDRQDTFSMTTSTSGSVLGSTMRKKPKERSLLSKEIKLESLCEQHRQNRESMHMSHIVHMWVALKTSRKRQRWLSSRAAESLRWRRQRRVWNSLFQYLVNHRILRRQTTKGLVRNSFILAQRAFDSWNDFCLVNLDHFKEASFWSRLMEQGARCVLRNRARRVVAAWVGVARENLLLRRGLHKLHHKRVAGVVKDWWFATCESRRTRWLSVRTALHAQNDLLQTALVGWATHANKSRSLVERGIRLLTFRHRKAMDLCFCALLFNVMNKPRRPDSSKSPSRMSTRAFGNLREAMGQSQPALTHSKRHLAVVAPPGSPTRKSQFLGVYRSRIVAFVDGTVGRIERDALAGVLRRWKGGVAFQARARYGVRKVQEMAARHRAEEVVGRWSRRTRYAVQLRDGRLALMRRQIRSQLLCLFAAWRYIKALSRPPPSLCLPLTPARRAAMPASLQATLRWEPSMRHCRARHALALWRRAALKERRVSVLLQLVDGAEQAWQHSTQRSALSCWRLLLAAAAHRRRLAHSLASRCCEQLRRRSLHSWRVEALKAKPPPAAPPPPARALGGSGVALGPAHGSAMPRAAEDDDSDIDVLLSLARGTASRLSRAASNSPSTLPPSLPPSPASTLSHPPATPPAHPDLFAGTALSPPRSPLPAQMQRPAAPLQSTPELDSSGTEQSAQPSVPLGEAADGEHAAQGQPPVSTGPARQAEREAGQGGREQKRRSEVQLSDSIMQRLKGLRARTQQLEADLLRGSPSSAPPPGSAAAPVPAPGVA